MCKYCCALCIHVFLYAEQSLYMLVAFFPPDLGIIIYMLRYINYYKLNDLGVGGGTFAICLVEFGQYMYCFVTREICSSRKSKHRDDSSDMEDLCSLLDPVFRIYGWFSVYHVEGGP